MARASVELIVEAAKAVNPLRRVEQQSKKVEQALKKNQRAARDVEAAFQRMGRKGIRSFRDLEANAARLGNRMGGLRGTIGKAAIAFAAFRAAQTGVQRVESERRIKLLGQRFGEYAQLQNAATQAAQKFNLSQTEANQALANAFARLRPLGVSLEDITSTFGGFRTAAVLGGATAQEASAAFTQLSQALGSGALRGDEFRSVAEQAPLVLQAISDETGIAAGDLKDYAKEGLLTSDIVIKALRRIEVEGAGRLAEALDGPAAKIKAFQNATEEVQVALTEAVVPELSKSFVILAEIINDLKPVIQGVGSFAAKVLGGIANTIQRIRDPKKLASEVRTDQARKLMAKGMSVKPPGSGMSNIPAISKADEAALFGPKPAALPKGTSPISQSLDAGKESAEAEKARKELEKQAEAAKKIAEQSKARVRTLEEQTRLAAALTEEERIQIERNIEIENIKAQIGVKTQEQVDAELAATKALYEQQDVTRARLKQEEEMAELKKKAQEEEKKRAEELNSIYQGIGNTIADGVVNALQGAVMGTVSLAEAATNLLNNLANQMLQLATNMILFGNVMGTMGGGGGGGLFGFISTGIQAIVGGLGGGTMGGSGYYDPVTGLGTAGPNFGLALGGIVGRNGIVPFANGGVVNRPTLFPMANGMGLMGEAGPEAVMPLTRGPGGRLGVEAHGGGAGPTNIVVNVDASGSNVEGDSQQQKALGKAIAVAVQSEIARQQRPGGLLS